MTFFSYHCTTKSSLYVSRLHGYEYDIYLQIDKQDEHRTEHVLREMLRLKIRSVFTH